MRSDILLLLISIEAMEKTMAAVRRGLRKRKAAPKAQVPVPFPTIKERSTEFISTESNRSIYNVTKLNPSMPVLAKNVWNTFLNVLADLRNLGF